jgi:hypothetical protein
MSSVSGASRPPKQFGFDTRKMTIDAGESRKVGIACILMARKGH